MVGVLMTQLDPITDRTAWLAERRYYLGATDLAAIAGKHKYKTALDVYLEKRGEKPRGETNRKAEAGLALEPLIRRWYAEEIGQNILPGRTVRHPEYPFIGVNTDGEIEGQDILVEIKTMDFCTREEWGSPGTDQIPSAYLIQAVTQIGVLVANGEHRSMNVVVKCDRGTMEIEEYIVQPAPELFATILELGVSFWNNHILKGIPPAPTTDDIDNLLYLYPKSTGEMLISDSMVDAMVSELADIVTDLKPLDKRNEEIRKQLKIIIGGNAGIDTFIGSFKSRRVTGRTKWKDVALAAGATPDLIAAHTGPQTLTLDTPL
jgi:putative phage-type endonuclease